MTNKDKVKAVFARELVPLGWYPVKDFSSGIFEKNGYYFVLYGKQSNNDGLCSTAFTDSKSIASAVTFFKLPSVSWHLEKHGWLLESGTLSSDVPLSYDNPDSEFYRQSVDVIIGKIESIVNKPDLESFNKRKRLKLVKKKGLVEKLRPVNESVVDTRFFQVTEELEGNLSCLKKNKFYHVIDVIQGQIRIVEVNEDGVAISDDEIIVNSDVFSVGIQYGVFSCVNLCSVDAMVDAFELEKASTSVVSELPEELEIFNLTGKQRVIVGTAFCANLNYTPLLYNSYSDSILDTIYCVLKEQPLVVSCLCGKSFSEEQAALILNYAESGYSLESVCSEFLDEFDFRMTVDDLNNHLTELEKNYRNKHFSTSSIIGLLRLASAGVTEPGLCVDKGEHVISLLYDKHVDFLSDVAEFFLCEGIDNDDFVYVKWGQVPNEIRLKIRSYFAPPFDFSFKGSSWFDFLDRIFSNAVSIQYSARSKYQLRFGSYLLGRDENSLVITDLIQKPVWRAVFINGKFIINSENESIITY